jgi:hypothetical protein
MGGEGADLAFEHGKTEQNEKLIEAIRKIQPGWFRLLSELIGGTAFLGLMWWDHFHNSGLVFFGGLGCGYIALFFSRLKLRFRLKALLYDLV